ncbi:MAG TPA: XRE family transcriptional regulator [Polyangiaceae bacterium]|nr:XRE family transcriptional regulator [Polyangiaceae bacterium]
MARTKASGAATPRPTTRDVVGDELGAAEIARAVADSLRRYRRERHLSLDELSARSGVSRAALSQIESGRTNPTLSVLWKIAVGLEVAFHDLLGIHRDEAARVLRAGQSPPLKSADGRMESRLLSPGGSATDIEVYDLRFLPKAVHRSDPHGKGTTETLVVLAGALRLKVTGETHDLGTGDSVYFRADEEHTYENRSNRETRCINVIRYVRS